MVFWTDFMNRFVYLLAVLFSPKILTFIAVYVIRVLQRFIKNINDNIIIRYRTKNCKTYIKNTLTNLKILLNIFPKLT